ncbi:MULTISPECIES: NAD-dependent epimerase/dehydratase family protein [unclassified Paenibacillus]|uniref:NAD-dependent epimerase/dehydratase family protein n=1 Tax=unclassified Paenibacillus TaxID=185978 RepID=UPI001048F1B1|nr:MULTISPECIES: NAD-dependent epimerase/dehydratase family protein [unclassified Paenibacillus]NIK68187.1 UDP-glucose 4-epimerase [Paenibacillus sp. BK720]TCM99596.1 UDP-glucose 4-epimerase [Paenibacillus sp. BK033]
MKALVTGGAGFIGSHLTDALVRAGAAVHVIDNLSTGFKYNVHPDAVLHELDINSDAAMQIIKQVKPDVVFHMAAQVDVQHSVADPAFDSSVNIVGTIRLMMACRQAEVGKLVFSSTSAVYGDSNKERNAEDAVTAPISYYGLSKLTGENYIRLFHEMCGLRYTILRYSNVYGPRQNASGEGGVVSIFMNKLKQALPLYVNGSGNQTRDFIYVQDVVQANLAAIHQGDQETINISTGLRTSINNLIQIIKLIHGQNVEIIYGPERPGDIMDSCLDNTKASQRLGWRPACSLFEGLSNTYQHVQMK